MQWPSLVKLKQLVAEAVQRVGLLALERGQASFSHAVIHSMREVIAVDEEQPPFRARMLLRG